MSDKTNIEWTDATWNPVTGCTKVSQGCKNCYAKHKAWPRLAASPGTVYFGREFEQVACHPERLVWPYWKAKPMRIFVNSMSDLFHEAVPFEFIAQVFWIMSVTTRHKYQVLTKRPQRMLDFFRWVDAGRTWSGSFQDERIGDEGGKIKLKWTPWREHQRHGGYDCCGPRWPFENVWLGVSVEDQATADERIPLLLQAPSVVRWISAEPLLGPIDLEAFFDDRVPGFSFPDEARGLDWVVAGGESGPHARPMHPDWARRIRDDCAAAGVPFLFKQWGEHAPNDRTFSEIEKSGRPCVAVHINGPGTQMAVMDRVGKKAAGRTLDGRTWDEYPA